jgi:hypothetical protein
MTLYPEGGGSLFLRNHGTYVSKATRCHNEDGNMNVFMNITRRYIFWLTTPVVSQKKSHRMVGRGKLVAQFVSTFRSFALRK